MTLTFSIAFKLVAVFLVKFVDLLPNQGQMHKKPAWVFPGPGQAFVRLRLGQQGPKSLVLRVLWGFLAAFSQTNPKVQVKNKFLKQWNSIRPQQAIRCIEPQRGRRRPAH